MNSREVQFDMVFRRVKVVFCIGSLLQQATVAVRSIFKRTFLEPSVAESLGERLCATLPVAAVESGSAAFT
mgnify:CR=1 FL=1